VNRLLFGIAFIGQTSAGLLASSVALVVTRGCEGTVPDASASPDSGIETSDLGSCANLLECVRAAEPSAAVSVAQVYGVRGACWDTEPADVCTRACVDSLEPFHERYPSVPACALCRGDEDCGGSTPACDTQINFECTECVNDSHCPATTPACVYQICEECSHDDHCPADRPRCDLSSFACEECVEDADCATTEYCENFQRCVPYTAPSQSFAFSDCERLPYQDPDQFNNPIEGFVVSWSPASARVRYELSVAVDGERLVDWTEHEYVLAATMTEEDLYFREECHTARESCPWESTWVRRVYRVTARNSLGAVTAYCSVDSGFSHYWPRRGP
jgi:hypothetical protein